MQLFSKFKILKQTLNFYTPFKIQQINHCRFMSLIEYEIDAKQNISSSEGQIQNIKKKKQCVWYSAKEQKQIVLVLKFHTPAKISQFQVKGYHTEDLQLEFSDKGKPKYNHKVVFQQHSDKITRSIPENQKEEIISEVVVSLKCKESKKMGINYIVFKGTPTQVKKNQQINKPFNAMLAGKRNESKAIFDKRKKVADEQDVQYLFDKNKDKQTKPKRKTNQQEELKKALKLSQKEYEKQIKPDMVINLEQMQEKQQIQTTFIQCKTKIYAAEQKKALNFVNAAWLEAQKKMEIEKFVDPKFRLSKHIKVKHLYGKNICIDGFYGAKKAKLEELIVQMGANKIQEPKDYCLIIAERPDSDKVIVGRKKNGVKILKAQFIEDCNRYNALMAQRDYYLN